MTDPNADHEFDLTHGGQAYTIVVYNVRDDDDGRLLYDVVVRNADGVVVLADDFVVQNPPVMAPDGTYTTETNSDGDVWQRPNMVENPVLAFELFTLDAVRMQL